MKTAAVIFASVALPFTGFTWAEGAATCTGADDCKVCKNCKYCKHCKHCAKKGGSCGVCRDKS